MEHFEGITRTPWWAGAAVAGLGLAFLGLGLPNVLGSAETGTETLVIGWVLSIVGAVIVERGLRSVRDRRKIVHVIRGTSAELKWGPTGSEECVPLAQLKRVGFRGGESSVTLVFELSDGRVALLGDESAHLSSVFRFVRRHFDGEMIWNGRAIQTDDQALF